MNSTLDSSIKSILSDLFRFKTLTIFKILTTLIINAVFIAVIFVTSRLIDSIQTLNTQKIVSFIALLASLISIRIIMSITNDFLKNRLTKKLENHISERIIKTLSLNNLYSWNKVLNGEKISFFDKSINEIVLTYHMIVFELFGSFVSIVSALVSVGIFFPLSLAYVLPFIIILILAQFLVAKPYSVVGKLSGEKYQQETQSLLSTFENFSNVKRNNFEEEYKGFFTKTQNNIFKKEIKIANIISLIIFINVGLSGLFSGLTVLTTIALSVNYGTISIGTIVGIISISFGAFSQGINTVNYIGSILQGKATLSQISSLLWFKNFKDITTNEFKTMEIETKNDKNKKTKFIINSGDKVLIEGSNGTGKSSLLEFLSGNFWNENLIIKVDNKDLSNEKVFNMSNLAYLCTNLHYFEDSTLKDNLLFGQKFKNNNTKIKNEELMKELLTIFKLEHLDLNSTIDQANLTYSEGEKQRIQIIRAILSKKPILIFDESLANIDAKNRDIIYDYLLNREQRTVIFVSHDFNYLKHKNQINKIINTNNLMIFEGKGVLNA